MQDLERLERLFDQVGQWSLENFGYQESRAVRGVCLGPVAPLLGMGEEIGEWLVAESEDQVLDAVADIGIFIADFSRRDGSRMPGWMFENSGRIPVVDEQGHMWSVLLCYLQLEHCVLKFHQGIRGLDETYHDRRDLLLASIWWHLDRYVEESYGRRLIDLVEEVYNDIVSKRNWRKESGQLGEDQIPRKSTPGGGTVMGFNE